MLHTYIHVQIIYYGVIVSVGDGAGVGKGRTIAGIIYQNYLEGRKKALWFVYDNAVCSIDFEVLFLRLSVSNDLKYDAIRCVILLCDDSTYMYLRPTCLSLSFHDFGYVGALLNL